MTVIETSEPSAAIQQLTIYNSNIGGDLNKKATFSVPAGTSWAIVGVVLDNTVVPGDIASLITSIEALTEVTSVNGDQIFGQIPSSILVTDHEAIVYVTSRMNIVIGTGGDTFPKTINNFESVKPPVNRKWCIFALRVPAPLDDTKIATLETAMEGITNIDIAEHLIDDTVSSRAAAAADLTINVHTRIESTI
jgi:hypothetical protein